MTSKTASKSGLVRWVAVATTLVAAEACAGQAQITRLDTRTYRVECKDSLARCLVRVQDFCRDYGYEVVQGTEQRSHVGSELPEGYESVNAKATIRCRQAVPVFGPDPNLAASASASAAPAPPAAVVTTPPAMTAPAAPPPPPVAPTPVEPAPPAPAAPASAPTAPPPDGGAP